MKTPTENYASILSCLINRIKVYSGFTSKAGLMNGRAGICILLYEYSRCFADKETEEYAGHLLDGITARLDRAGTGFETGITGIAWTINYLIINGYVEGYSDDILEDIDTMIQKTINNTSQQIMTGLYWVSRLPSGGYRIKDQTGKWLKDTYHLLCKQKTGRLSDGNIIYLLYCCHILRVSGLFPGLIRRLIRQVYPSVMQACQNMGHGCEKFILVELCRQIPEMQTLLVNGNTTQPWPVVLLDVGKIYVYCLLFEGSFNIFEYCHEKIRSVISDLDTFNGLMSLMNPENISLNSHIGGLTLSLIAFYKKSDRIK